MALSKKKAKKAAEQRKAIALLVVVAGVLIAGVVWQLNNQSKPKCPQCGQHFLFVDNSDAFSEVEKEKLGNGADGGLVSVVWDEMSVGEQLHVYALSPETMDAEELISVERIADAQDVSMVTAAPRRVAMRLKNLFLELEKSLTAVGETSMSNSRIFESLNRIAFKINNHHRINKDENGGPFRYSITVYSDLLQNSDLYSFYRARPLGFSEWKETPSYGPSKLSFEPGADVTITLCKIPKAIPQQNKSVDEFWLAYLGNSGARLSGRDC